MFSPPQFRQVTLHTKPRSPVVNDYWTGQHRSHICARILQMHKGEESPRRTKLPFGSQSRRVHLETCLHPAAVLIHQRWKCWRLTRSAPVLHTPSVENGFVCFILALRHLLPLNCMGVYCQLTQKFFKDSEAELSYSEPREIVFPMPPSSLGLARLGDYRKSGHFFLH